MGARGSTSLVDEVILTKEYQTCTTVFESTLNRTIGEDVEVRWEDVGKGLRRMVSLLGW